ncbi:hypothetical protein [Bradyrhizobium neotropicale]|uniref:hypothetical protein n=1 Tax=Bradyrhizobium neotropicale TaxID=1497615 RepID=UPI0011AB50C1|nr:hypothetical protein [Bradyrhizobium neotropicale]
MSRSIHSRVVTLPALKTPQAVPRGRWRLRSALVRLSPPGRFSQASKVIRNADIEPIDHQYWWKWKAYLNDSEALAITQWQFFPGRQIAM